MVVHSEYLGQNEVQVNLFMYKLDFGRFWDIFVSLDILQKHGIQYTGGTFY